MDRFPDIANHGLPAGRTGLAKVGMSHIEVPLKFDAGTGHELFLLGKADAYVSLDKEGAKGIHMSRLFVVLQNELEKNRLELATIQNVLRMFLESHKDLSSSAHVAIRFDLPLKRKALLSDNAGWRSYPIQMRGAVNKGKKMTQVSFRVVYSSTCPCSAALARQLIQNQFSKDFSGKDLNFEKVHKWLGEESGIIATPHGQRSHGDISLTIKDNVTKLSFVELIDAVEKALGTPVQTAVKREDEQEFARLNGSNLMFAEDAARKMVGAISQFSFVDGYRIQASHLESLHPHDAVAIAEKNYHDWF